MSLFIGGHHHGQLLSKDESDLKLESIPKQYGSKTGMQRPTESYIRTQVSFHGEVKTFYIISGKQPIEMRDEIINLWDQVKSDIYAI
ncbi:hypothetical protein [Acinetobacter pittii]|uniref:Uncharacterized protein n=1 Tax=Acinetobacter pittii TaxID=48296 RepID=A0A6H0FTB4_ACIPI|nr:hypothetical protein [Acinetobacter pittii]AUM25908.1 hypothetical protein BVD86_02860 [Acinetobacter pittii]QIT17580.1 hypothetical protein G8E09_07535 [Acinetobacter pittii]